MSVMGDDPQGMTFFYAPLRSGHIAADLNGETSAQLSAGRCSHPSSQFLRLVRDQKLRPDEKVFRDRFRYLIECGDGESGM